jgi:bacillopeptidase F
VPPDIARALDNPPATEFVETLVEMSEQVDLDALKVRFDAATLDKTERRRATIAALEEIAARRKPLEDWLDAELLEGSVDLWRGYAIVNRLYVSATPDVLRTLAARDDVAALLPIKDEALLSDKPVAPRRPSHDAESSLPSAASAPGISWALDAMGVRRAWAAGWTGRGVVVGSLDTGIAGGHVSLRKNHRTERGWFDPLAGRGEPWDDHGHGTETLGCAVGAGATPGEVGVAPGARWIAVRVNPLNRYNAHGMTAGADWMLREGKADVVLCAWGHGAGRCETMDLSLLKALRLAEIVVAFPAGNSGPLPGSGETPAALPPLFPGDVPPLAVAATDASGAVFALSSRGPSPCAGAGQFPWIAAPGSDVRVPSYGSPAGFETGAGTSLSAGYIAGVAALLLQRCPSLTVPLVEKAMAETAKNIGEPGPDTDSGYGLVNVPAALEWAGRHCPARAGSAPPRSGN